jgi:hypothetical protein
MYPTALEFESAAEKFSKFVPRDGQQVSAPFE